MLSIVGCQGDVQQMESLRGPDGVPGLNPVLPLTVR